MENAEFISTVIQIPSLLKKKVKYKLSPGAHSVTKFDRAGQKKRQQDLAGSVALFTADMLSPPAPATSDPHCSRQRGLSVHRQAGEGLWPCLCKIQFLTLSEAAIGLSSVKFRPAFSCKGASSPMSSPPELGTSLS